MLNCALCVKFVCLRTTTTVALAKVRESVYPYGSRQFDALCSSLSLEVEGATSISTPGKRDAWGPRSEYVGTELHALFRMAVRVRPWLSYEKIDIQSDVMRLTQCFTEPLMKDWVAMQRTVRYLMPPQPKRCHSAHPCQRA